VGRLLTQGEAGRPDRRVTEADHIVVGAGSAGCALAGRLAEAGRDVLVIEHGGSDRSPLIRMPAALSIPMNMARYDWGYVTEPEPHLGGRRLACPRGKVLGGSSSINGMVWVRGHPRDFDRWAEMGAEGWSGADVAPYFERLEDWRPVGEGESAGDRDWRGRGGPVRVTRGARANPLDAAFVAAGVAAGFGATHDHNGERQEGFGPMERTVWRGERWSAADAYLRPALRARRLRLTRAFARRVVIEAGRATGVEIETPRGVEVVRARAEVIVAAGAINAPKLLMLSGMGPAEHLRAHGVAVVADRRGVGANLQDHLEVYVQQACTQPVTLNGRLDLARKALIGAEWLFLRRGAGATNHFESCAFVRSAAGVEYPDIQFHFLPAAIRYDGRAAASGHGFQAHVGPMRSPSRGTVRLKGPDPAAAPAIRFNYMSRPQDWADFRHCVRLTREIFAQAPFDPFRGPEIAPGAAVQSDAALDDWLRDHVESAYHPCGTCRIGRRDDPLAVVDPDLRVIGVEGLRVADSSVFPRITNGNLNAPSIMVGEKAADLVLGRPAPPASNRRPWINPRWRESDR
jgi:choline dehydrogenase